VPPATTTSAARPAAAFWRDESADKRSPRLTG
jgi:hypothetical protein